MRFAWQHFSKTWLRMCAVVVQSLGLLFTIDVAAQAKEREGVISLPLLRASLPDSTARELRPIAAICSCGLSCVAWGSVLGWPTLQRHGPGQFLLQQFAQWESACGLCATPLCVSWQEIVPHWGNWPLETVSAMALTYDFEECVLQFSTKVCVRAAVAGGWRGVNAACLSKPALTTPSGKCAMLWIRQHLQPSLHQRHRVPYLLPIFMCILLRFGLSTWIHSSYIYGDNCLQSRAATLCTYVEVRQSLKLTEHVWIPNGPFSKPCIWIAA